VKVDLMGEVAVRLGGKITMHLSWDNTQWKVSMTVI